MDIFALIFPLLALVGTIVGLVFIVRSAREEGWRGSKVTGTVVLSLLTFIFAVWALLAGVLMGWAPGF